MAKLIEITPEQGKLISKQNAWSNAQFQLNILVLQSVAESIDVKLPRADAKRLVGKRPITEDEAIALIRDWAAARPFLARSK